VDYYKWAEIYGSEDGEKEAVEYKRTEIVVLQKQNKTQKWKH
jgi:hypothetical protein